MIGCGILLYGVLQLYLGAGDSMFFRADVPHSYESRSTHEVRLLDVISYGPRASSLQ